MIAATASVRSFLLFLLIVRLATATQTPFSSLPQYTASELPRVVTSELSAFIEDVRNKSNTAGIALGIVRIASDNASDVEFGSWGRMTEEGNGSDMSQDVCHSGSFLLGNDMYNVLLDPHQHCFVFESVSCDFHRYSHG